MSDDVNIDIQKAIADASRLNHGFVFRRCPLCDENKKVTFDDARTSNWICRDCKKVFKEMKKMSKLAQETQPLMVEPE